MWVVIEEQEDPDSGLWVLQEVHGPYTALVEAEADKPRLLALPRGKGRVGLSAWQLQSKGDE